MIAAALPDYESVQLDSLSSSAQKWLASPSPLVGGGLLLLALAFARTIYGCVLTVCFHMHGLARFAFFLLTIPFSFTKRVFLRDRLGPKRLASSMYFTETASESCSA
jgi:hypothetical protein